MKIQSWGYGKDDAQVFDLDEGENLPSGYYSNPASVPGSDAEKAYKADAKREGAPTPLISAEATPAPVAANDNASPEKPAKAEKADKADKADVTK